MEPISDLDITSVAARLESLLHAQLEHPPSVVVQGPAGRPASVQAARIAETDPRIMRFEAFKRDHPRRTLDAAGLKRYAMLCTCASQGRAHLRKHPELVHWYARREMLMAMGRPASDAGPSPTTPQGKRLAREQARAEKARKQQEHEWMMSCELPRPHMVRPGERSADALAERREATKLLREILDYRKREEEKARRTSRLDGSTPIDTLTAAERRTARCHMGWRARAAEDLMWLADHGLHVSCERPTQRGDLIAREPFRWSA